VLAFDPKDVTGLEIVTADDTIAAEAGDGRWQLIRPRALPRTPASLFFLIFFFFSFFFFLFSPTSPNAETSWTSSTGLA